VRTGAYSTEVRDDQQWFEPKANYTGDAHVHLPTAAAFLSAGGTFPTATGSPVPAASAAGYSLFFTVETRYQGHGEAGDYLGLYAIASANGKFLGENGPPSVYPLKWGDSGRHTNMAHCHADGEEVYERQPAYGPKISYDNDDTFVFGAKREADGSIWLGEVGCSYGLKCLGFEVEGRKGWLQAQVDESGLVLKSYYWEGGGVQRYECVDNTVCMQSASPSAVPFDQCNVTCHP